MKKKSITGTYDEEVRGRINQAMYELGLTPYKVAKKMEYSENAIRSICEGRTKTIKMPFIREFAVTYGVNDKWLLIGEGSMLKVIKGGADEIGEKLETLKNEIEQRDRNIHFLLKQLEQSEAEIKGLRFKLERYRLKTGEDKDKTGTND